MNRIILFLLVGFSIVGAAAQAAVELADDAPDRHVVEAGDTLWGISARFLKDPWRWPEVWRLNREEIANPHRIFPGQIVVLDRSGGQPQLRLAKPLKLEPKVYDESSIQPIPSIPQRLIEPFLAEPLVVDENGLDGSARIIATQEDRVFVGTGNVVYVAGADPQVRKWSVYRPAKPIVDPVTMEVLGHEAFYLGSANQVRKGDPATFEVVAAKQEMGRGDRLLPTARPDVVAYAPHAPTQNVDGRVITIYGGIGQTGETGRGYVLTLNRGKRDGLEVGHVLALYRNGREVAYGAGEAKEIFNLPEERYGLVFVFRTFDRISYAFVMNAGRPVIPNDFVRTP
jgi:hypothetical protein